MALNCFTYFGMKSFDEVDNMLIEEYELLMKSYSLKRLDQERDMHWQAYLNMAVQQTEERGKKTYSKFPTFKKFFDYEKSKRELLGIKEIKQDKYKDIKNLILIANKRGG